MLSLRLQAVASFVAVKDKVVDIGCDHGYLSIYLIENKLCQSVIATDINANALKNATQNIFRANLQKKIPTVLSSGIQNIQKYEFDTLVISGMGTNTILKIMADVQPIKVKKVIIQSNNDLYLLRKSLIKLGFFLKQEKVVFEKGHYYTIGLYNIESKKLSLRQKLFGIYNDSYKNYYHFLYHHLQDIYYKMGSKNYIKKIKLFLQIKLLTKYL